MALRENRAVRIGTNKSRIDGGETPREREQRGRIEKLERELEQLKQRLPAEPATAKPPAP